MTAAEPTPEPTPAAEPVAPAAEPTGWMDGSELSTDMKANPTIQKYGSAEALARGHVELQSAFGGDRIAWPGKDAEPKAFDPIYSKLGRPETAEGYELSGWKPPDGVPFNTEAIPAMIEKMHGHKLTKEQAHGVINDYAEVQAAAHAAMQTQATQTNVETRQALETEWGAAFPVKMENGKKAALAFIEQAGLQENPFDTITLSNGTLLGDHPAMLRFMGFLGDQFAEDGGPGPGTVRTTATPDEAAGKLAEMLADAETNKILKDQGHPLHKQMYEKMTALQQAVTPGE